MVEETRKQFKLTSSMEDYLETIAILKEENSVVRVRDISLLMNVKNPSVTGALKGLVAKGLIVHERYGYVDLTGEGQKIAARIKERHDTLIEFFTEMLGVGKEIAERDACKIEHAISTVTFSKLVKFIKKHNASSGKKG